MRERFARCLVLRQRNQALHRASELARGNDETCPDGFAGWTTARICLAPLAQPWVGGGSKLPSSATSADPGSVIAAAQQAGGGQGSIWSPIFQQAAPGAVCFLSAPDSNESHCEPDSGPNVRTAGATGGMAGSKKSADDNK